MKTTTAEAHGCLPRDGNPPTERLWRVEDVAHYLNLSESWVYKEAALGTLPSIRIGAALRFEPDEIRRFARGELTTTVVRRSRLVRRTK